MVRAVPLVTLRRARKAPDATGSEGTLVLKRDDELVAGRDTEGQRIARSGSRETSARCACAAVARPLSASATGVPEVDQIE